MIKVTVLAQIKLHLNSILDKLQNFLDKQYINNKMRAKALNKL